MRSILTHTEGNFLHITFALTCFELRNNSSDSLNQDGMLKSESLDGLFLNIAPYTPSLITCPYTATGVKLAGLKMYTKGSIEKAYQLYDNTHGRCTLNACRMQHRMATMGLRSALLQKIPRTSTLMWMKLLNTHAPNR